MELSLFDRVRQGTAEVVRQAGMVRLDESRLVEYAGTLPLHEALEPEVHAERHLLGRGEETLAFFITLDAINFGSGYFPKLQKRPGMSGYFTVATSLTEHFQAHGPLSAADLAALSPARIAAILGQETADPDVMELMGLFARALNDLGRYLADKYDGSFVNLVESAGGSAHRLCELLIQLPFFNDVETYIPIGKAPIEVPFYKRAQLTAADLSIAFDRKGWGRFDDLDRLTIFADNLVPHVLRLDGVLTYDPDLAERIDREELIPAGSPEEIEIRAGAVHAVERLVEMLRERGEPVTAQGLDYVLWHRGQQPEYKRARPRHRTRTVFY